VTGSPGHERSPGVGSTPTAGRAGTAPLLRSSDTRCSTTRRPLKKPLVGAVPICCVSCRGHHPASHIRRSDACQCVTVDAGSAKRQVTGSQCGCPRGIGHRSVHPALTDGGWRLRSGTRLKASLRTPDCRHPCGFQRQLIYHATTDPGALRRDKTSSRHPSPGFRRHPERWPGRHRPKRPRRSHVVAGRCDVWLPVLGYIELDLELVPTGGHVDELRTLIAEHPLRERFWAPADAGHLPRRLPR
jgi:hypothetical protein